jgi:DNA-binding GntR family transcriptional regulator
MEITYKNKILFPYIHKERKISLIKNILKFSAIAIILSGIGLGIYYYNTRNSAASAQVEKFKEVAAKQEDIKINFLADGKACLLVLRLSFPISSGVPSSISIPSFMTSI